MPLPAMVMLLPVVVETNESVPPQLWVMPDEKVTEPDVLVPTVRVPLPVSVPLKPVKLMERQTAPVPMVIVPTEGAVKKTSSAAVGTDWPPVPPELAAHLTPAVVSQVPVLPTQKRLATEANCRW